MVVTLIKWRRELQWGRNATLNCCRDAALNAVEMRLLVVVETRLLNVVEKQPSIIVETRLLKHGDHVRCFEARMQALLMTRV